MTEVTDPRVPSNKWKKEILQEEISCSSDFLNRCGSHEV